MSTAEIPEDSEAENCSSSMQGEPKLCHICSSIGLNAQSFAIGQSHDYEAAFRLGTVSEIRQRDCALCSLALTAIGYNPQSSESTKVVQDFQFELRWATSGRFEYANWGERPNLYLNLYKAATIDIFPEDSIRGALLCIDRGFEIRKYDQLGDRVRPAAYIKLGEVQDVQIPDTPPLICVGRKYNKHCINLDLVRAWLTTCDSFHENECSNIWTRDLSSSNKVPWIYCIDVKHLRLVRIPRTERYTALSYVWGSVDQFRTKKMSLDLLLTPGALSGVLDQIPQTILDAIDLTGDLGFDYLWVDSICIVQDDDESKDNFIPNMHVIYGNAWLTIIAQTAEDANIGLQGYRPGTRGKPQAVREVVPGLSLGTAPHYGQIVYQSKHAQRAWTLQEACFSQRRLIFADGQVYFHCRRAIWREDFAAEDINMRCNLGEFDNAFAINDPNMPPTTQYAKMVREYSRRKLSYDSDAMNAFKGALTFMESTLETPCYSGLPEAYLNWALLWASSESLIRRTAFPSYTWVGWKGEVRLPRLPGDYTYLEWLNDFCWIEYGKRKIDGIDIPFLEFETMRALFKLGDALPSPTDTSKSEEQHEEAQARPRRRTLLDSRNKICGFVNIDDPASCPRFKDDVVFLILLSVAQPWDLNRFEDTEIAYDSKPDNDPTLPHASESQSTDSTATNETTQPPWDITQPNPKAGTTTTDHGWGYLAKNHEDTFNFDFYNVMLVHVPIVMLTPDNSGEVKVTRISERVGLGILHHKAPNWALEEPWEDYILLG